MAGAHLIIVLDRKGKNRLVLGPDGVRFPRGYLTRTSLRLAWRLVKRQEVFMPWGEIAEWQVHDCDGNDDYYMVILKNGQRMGIKRPYNRVQEAGLLDYVQKSGAPMRSYSVK